MGFVFTQQQVKALKAKATGKRQEHRDLGAPNLYIVVQPKSGETSFVIRPTVAGKQRKITLGHFPAMSLADAREEATRHKTAARQGKTAGALRLAPAQTMSVSEAWNLYWQHEASSRKSAAEKQRIFQKDIAPAIGKMPLNEVTRSDLAKLVSDKFATAKTASNRLHSLLARFFKWSFTQGHNLTKLDSNPMLGVAKMHSERDSARRRYLTPQELKWWFQALPAAGEYATIHELLMRTLCRFSDILNLTWGEVVERNNGDVLLEIRQTKNAEPHLVYLHPTAAKSLPERPKGAVPNDKVFKLRSRSSKPVERLRRRMSELAKEEGLTVPHWQPHDYRRTGTTLLAGMMDDEDHPLVPEHILGRLLAHKEQRVIKHYNVYQYYREKKAALTIWNEALDNLTTNLAEQQSIYRRLELN
jgi:integrase